MVNEINKQVNFMIERYEAGALGTPDAPKKDGSVYTMFWKGYHGWVTPTEVKGTISYPSVKAGKICAKNDREKVYMVDVIVEQTLKDCALDESYHYDDRVNAVTELLEIYIKAGDQKQALEWVQKIREIIDNG